MGTIICRNAYRKQNVYELSHGVTLTWEWLLFLWCTRDRLVFLPCHPGFLLQKHTSLLDWAECDHSLSSHWKCRSEGGRGGCKGRERQKRKKGYKLPKRTNVRVSRLISTFVIISAYNSILSFSSKSKTLRPPSEMVHNEKQQKKK